VTRSFRPARAIVDLEAVRHNVRAVRSVVGTADVCAVVKADGYGHGAVPVARAAVEAGASCLAVALVEEGVRLREAGIDAPVLVLSEPPYDAADEVIAQRLTPTLYTRGGVEAFSWAARQHADDADVLPFPVEVKVDTGMHRVGAPPGEALALARLVDERPELELSGIWTHFAVADDRDRQDDTDAQIAAFDAFSAAVSAAGLRPARRHAANSAGALFTGAHYDLVRAGLAVYGYSPDPSSSEVADLRPALSLVAAVSYVKELDAGERLSYGLRYELAERSVIATVPLGYADGVPRRLSGTGACALVGGRKVPIAGAVTMDQLLLDCGPGASVRPGDEVVLIGRQGDAVVTADDWAGRVGTISYEILCGIGPRVPRVYRP
jgi:alanine racemase